MAIRKRKKKEKSTESDPSGVRRKGFSSVLAAPRQAVAESNEYEWDGAHGKGDKSQDGGRPVEPQAIVHVAGRQGQQDGAD